MKKKISLLKKLIRDIAPRIGAKVLIEPRWGVVGQIVFKNGRHTYFRYSALDINRHQSSQIAKDKDYSNYFMETMGYPIVPGSKTFFRDDWGKAIGELNRGINAGYKHARKIGFPVIVKPNSSSHGFNVTVAFNKQEFYTAVKNVFKHDRIALIQRLVQGRDYRIVVLDKRVISAYERIPLNIVGDGRSNIEELLKLKQKYFSELGRSMKIQGDDPRIALKLKHQKLRLRSIPAKGQAVYLLDNANLSTGGDSVDVTRKMHPEFKKLAIKLTSDMGLRLSGVDLMVKGDIEEKPQKYWVLEINSSPGLDHYAKIGRAQEKIVENLYLQVLKHMEK